MNEREQTIASAFDARAASTPDHEQLFGEYARQVLESMEVKAGARLLEVGAGCGWATKLLGKLAPGAQAIGVDASAEVVKLADEATDWTSRARFERMGATALDFPDDRFAHALCLGSLELLDDPAPALAELKRVLESGGRLEVVVVAHAGSGCGAALEAALGVSPCELDGPGWQAALEAAGFTVEAAAPLRDGRGPEALAGLPDSPWASDAEARARLLGAGALHLRGTA